MEKIGVVRSVYRSARFRSSLTAASASASASAAAAAANKNNHLRNLSSFRTLFSLTSPSPSVPSKSTLYDCQSPLVRSIGCTRSFSEDVAHMPVIRDHEIQRAFKDLMATNWDELPDSVIHDAKSALSKNTDDKAGQEVLKNIFSAAEAVEEFCAIIMNIKMEIDDQIGLSGEDVKPLSNELSSALRTVFHRYATYLDAFGPDESYLRKKVETELGSKMIFLKMRCAGLGSEWGKVTVLGTSGLAGSYVEQRA